ncbi:MAG TPA: ZIP family metal transporter, partial [Clostridia bacterium]|nr:ZIP family metal transporter [Clostridia bacterium]
MRVINILLSSLLAGLVTGVGALIAIVLKEPSDKLISLTLGFASGIMIGISAFSLIPNSLDTGTVLICIIGFVGGGIFLFLVDIGLPHIHKIESDCDAYLKMGYFIAIGIAFHNLPEGIAIGASNTISEQLGLMTALAIGLHNIAEGLSVAVPLRLGRVGKKRIVFITTFTGLSTFLGAILGIMLVNISQLFISFALAFAAGAMIYIASDEL